MILALLIAQAAAAPPKDPPRDVQGELPAAATIHERKKPDSALRAVEGRLVTSAAGVSASDVVDEMVDEFASDLTRLGAARVGPVLLQKVQLSRNMNPAYATVLEARLAAALSRASGIPLVRCIECGATRSRVENGEWVVTSGVISREQAQGVARKYGARTFLDVSLSLDEPSSLAMDVEMVRAEDASVAFAEQYRLDADRALLYRGADHAQSREEKLRDLEDRLNQRPRFSHTVEMGAMMVPADSGALWGGVGRYLLTEQFGDDRQYEAGLSAGGFLNTSSLTGALVGGVFRARLGDANVYTSRMTFGLNAGVFLTGNAGNAPIGGVMLRWLPATRIAFHAGANYMVPFQLRNQGDHFGGFCPELGVSLLWN